MQPSDDSRIIFNATSRLPKLCVVIAAALFVCGIWTLAVEPSGAAGSQQAARGERAAGDERVSVAVARERASVMHDVYSSTLHTMHRHYFHANRSVLPARALEDVFQDIARKSKTKARWISVNAKAMSVDHEPADEFERQAASAIAAGKEKYEAVENGLYRSASPIHLGAGCVNCHTGFFSGPSKTPRFAGLVIDVPVTED